MKTILSFLMIFCFTSQAFAAIDVVSAVNDFTYAVTVDWDQKDQNFYDAQALILFEKLDQSGLSKEQIVEKLAPQFPSSKALEEFKLKVNGAQGNTMDDLAQALRENAQNLYDRGASWNGSVVTTGLYVLVGAVIAYGIYRIVAFRCTEQVNQYQCYHDEVTSTYRCGNQSVCVKQERKF